MAEAVVLKKYGNRRLYDTTASRYVTLTEVEDMVQRGTDIEVRDAKTGDDLTKEVLVQLIMHVKFCSTIDIFSIQWMLDLSLNENNGCFVHFIANKRHIIFCNIKPTICYPSVCNGFYNPCFASVTCSNIVVTYIWHGNFICVMYPICVVCISIKLYIISKNITARSCAKPVAFLKIYDRSQGSSLAIGAY